MSVSTVEAAEAGGLDEREGVAARTPWQLFWRRLRADRVAFAGLAFIVALLLVAILQAPIRAVLGVPEPNVQSSEALDVFGTPTGPSAEHWFGVDTLGRDVFSRVLAGARVSLEVALISTGIAVIVGTLFGMLAAYYSGWVDTVFSRLADVLLAFPVLLLALGIAAACSGADGCAGGLIKPGIGTVVFTIAFINWVFVFRIIRGQTLSLREKEYVDAARSLGASHRRIIFREILPNLIAPVIVYASLLIPQNILLEAALSFLGVGVQPPQASWGAMIADAVTVFDSAWWFMFFPGVALLLTVLAFNLVGDGLQDALNPRSDR